MFPANINSSYLRGSKGCGFRKGYNTFYCLILMIEKFRKARDKGHKFGALLTDLSKAFDCLNHELLIAKLAAYGFDKKALHIIFNYLNDRRHRTKISGNYSSLVEILFGIPQGSILGPLLFNIYLCDLFFNDFDITIASFADDTTPYVCSPSISSVIDALQVNGSKIFYWFNINSLKANASKSHLLLSTKEKFSLSINESIVESSTCEKLLGVLIDNDLTFDQHVTTLCNKASQKLSALSRVANFMSIEKRRTLFKAFIMSQFEYCSLIWMFHSRGLNNRINRIHERALKITYSDCNSSF